ncbi:MAG: hypothetical protein V4555_09170 [Acidobacteriota bacterium]
MRNEERNENVDGAWQGGVNWSLGLGSQHVSDVIWQCQALRAGRLYNRSLFGSKEEAEQFATKMREVEPDQMFSVEAIRASTVWN